MELGYGALQGGRALCERDGRRGLGRAGVLYLVFGLWLRLVIPVSVTASGKGEQLEGAPFFRWEIGLGLVIRPLVEARGRGRALNVRHAAAIHSSFHRECSQGRTAQ